MKSELEILREALREIRDSTYRNALQLRAMAQAALDKADANGRDS